MRSRREALPSSPGGRISLGMFLLTPLTAAAAQGQTRSLAWACATWLAMALALGILILAVTAWVQYRRSPRNGHS